MSECKEIVASENGGVLEVSIQRPERKNALTHAMYTAINQAFDRAENEPSIRALLITGEDHIQGLPPTLPVLKKPVMPEALVVALESLTTHH